MKTSSAVAFAVILFAYKFYQMTAEQRSNTISNASDVVISFAMDPVGQLSVLYTHLEKSNGLTLILLAIACKLYSRKLRRKRERREEAEEKAEAEKAAAETKKKSTGKKAKKAE